MDKILQTYVSGGKSIRSVSMLASFSLEQRGASWASQAKELRQVCCRLVTLQSSSRYQDAFTSLAPA